MKVRFYVDVPHHMSDKWVLCATSFQITSPVVGGFTRVAFDVNLPTKEYDVLVHAEEPRDE